MTIERVVFPCKTCRHFHRGTVGPALKISGYALKTVVDDGCIEEQCHCGKITPSEMLR